MKTLAERLHSKIVENDDNPGIINDIAANYSRLLLFVLYLDNARIRTNDVVPLVTRSSFVGNFGGIFGMWLGFSCVSLLQSLHSFLILMVVKLKNKLQPKVCVHFTPKSFHSISLHPISFHPTFISPHVHFTPHSFHPTIISPHIHYTPFSFHTIL